jgi:hypothetical protein
VFLTKSVNSTAISLLIIKLLACVSLSDTPWKFVVVQICVPPDLYFVWYTEHFMRKLIGHLM